MTDPARHAAIADPQTFFAQLGEQAETQIQHMAQRLAGPKQPGEDAGQQARRLKRARLQAEEELLTELICIGGPDGTVVLSDVI